MKSNRIKRLFFLLCFIGLGISTCQAQSIKLPNDCQKILKSRFRSWKLAEIQVEIIDYFKRERAYEQPNLIKGDWNGDGKNDYAVLLQNKNNSQEKIIVALMKTRTSYKNYTLNANDDCIMSVKKESKGYDFEKKKSFRYKNDAIFTYFWEKAGSSYIWEKGKFRAISTSD